MNLYHKISIAGVCIVVAAFAIFAQIDGCRAEGNSIQLSAYVVPKVGPQTINDFDFSTVNVEYPLPLALDQNSLRLSI